MENMMDYLKWRGDIPVSSSPLTPIDFLILSELVHSPLENLEKCQSIGSHALSDISPYLHSEIPEKDEKSMPYRRYQLWNTAAASKRFGEAVLESFSTHFDEEEQIQFAAGFFRMGKIGVIAFRGTDSTLVGWHEDLRLSFESPIPAQRDAISYVQAMVDRVDQLFLCGHSKGGNLAMYSAIHSEPEIRKKICGVYNFDGPGLNDASLASESWKEMNRKVYSFMPESSVVGKLLGYQTNFITVVSDSASFLQHNPFHWHVQGNNFVTTTNSTLSSEYTDYALHDFLANCDMETRKALVNTLFSILQATGAKKMSEIVMGFVLHWDDVIAAVKNLPEKNRSKFFDGLKLLGESFGGNVSVLINMIHKRNEE